MRISQCNFGSRTVTRAAVLFFVAISSQRWSSLTNERKDNHSNNESVVRKVQRDSQVVPPFWPNQLFDEYKRLHSKEAIKLDGNIQRRKYAVVSYYCPRRADNILHNLFNNIAWAIIHNRTILFIYEGHEHVKSGDSFEYCQNVLRLAEWVTPGCYFPTIARRHDV